MGVPPMSSDPKTYSIALRFRRVTYEDAYVAVPVTGAVMKTQPEPDGSFRIDWDALTAAGLSLCTNPQVEWVQEESQIAIHPTQGPKPDNRKMLDGFHLKPPS